MNFEEIGQGDGTIQVNADGNPLTCPVCKNTRFHERNALLHTRLSSFFKMEWMAGDTAVNFVCSNCGYIFWFLS
jgi:predicted nucleic-acid-binding Zn-ribbon protein